MIAERSAIVARGMGVRRGGRWLLRPVAFGIAEGVIGVAGPPGVGKSTLLATFATLRRPHAGALRILGHDIGTARGLRAARARIGFLPGRFQWARNMTAEELVTYAAYYKRVRAPAAHDIMKRLDVADSSRTELALLPPDVRLRAGLAAACVHGPDLVVLDDPLDELYARRAAADEAAVAELIPLIRSLAPTVVVSATRPEHLAPWCREVHTLARGRLTRHPSRPSAPLLSSAPRATSASRASTTPRETTAPRAPTSQGRVPVSALFGGTAFLDVPVRRPDGPDPSPPVRPQARPPDTGRGGPDIGTPETGTPGTTRKPWPRTAAHAPETSPDPPPSLPPIGIDHAGQFVQTHPPMEHADAPADTDAAARAVAAARPMGAAPQGRVRAGRRPARSGAGV